MHRPGHLDNTGSGNSSMNRRNYLKAFAIGTVAAGALLESCSTDKKNHDDDKENPHHPEDGKSPAADPWGYISLYEPDVITIEDAQKLGPPKAGDNRIRIPFFNSNEIDVSPGQVIGFHLKKIGCPGVFAIAVNLVDQDHAHTDDREAMKKRNTDMDDQLIKLGYKKEPWQPAQPC
jgi:hypothetical protein